MAYIRGGGGAEKPTLLWTNPNPTSDFAAQAINIDISAYSGFLIEYKYEKTIAKYDYFYQDAVNLLSPYNHYITVSMNDNSYRMRRVLIDSNNHINFAGATNAVGTIYASIIIPYKIYGYKKSLI